MRKNPFEQKTWFGGYAQDHFRFQQICFSAAQTLGHALRPKREATNKDIQIVREIDPNTGTIWSDAYQFRQVLINLLTNAIYATAAGGRIRIILEAVGDNVKLTVRDNGHGIPKENMKKIFEPFFSTKPPSEGTGLGLFVTRGIVEKLCGTIEVESRLGDGTRFYVNLPRYCKVKEDLDQDERIRFLDRLANKRKSIP